MARPTERDDSSLTLPPPRNAPDARPLRIACVASTYHRDIVGAMIESARATLERAGLASEDFLLIDAPGAFELPIVSQRLARRDDVDAVIAFGLVLKGETEHDLHIAGAVAHALARIGLETDTPVLFGLLTCSTIEQAERRARHRDDQGLDKGHEVAKAAIEVLHALHAADASGSGGSGADATGPAQVTA